MANFFPNQNEKQEENLQPIFDRNKSYTTIKDQSRKNFLQQNYPRVGLLTSISNFLNINKLGLAGGFAGTFVIAAIIVGLVLNFQNGTILTPKSLIGGIPVSAEEAKVVASEQTTLGVGNNSSYTLNLTKDVEKVDLEKNLIVSPNLPYKIEQKSKQQYEIKFDSPLEAKQIVKFELKTNPEKRDVDPKINLSWAFQVKDTFRVINTLPRDKSTGVPVNTGIEIVFNTPKFKDPSNLISISPKTEGEFKRNGSVEIFVPKNLKPSTLYTVSIKAGLGVDGSDEKLDKDYSFQFETAVDANAPNDFTDFNQDFYEFTNNIKPSFELAGLENNPTLQADIFSFTSLDDFENSLNLRYNIPNWAFNSQSQNQIDTAGLTKVQSGKFNLADSQYGKYFSLPKNLDLGYYLVEATVNNKKIQAYFQVSNFAVSLTEYKDKSLLWVVDLITKKPISGSQLSAKSQNVSATTNDQGLATFNTPNTDASSSFFYRVQVGDKIMLLPHKPNANQYDDSIQNAKSVQGDYWSYVYTDKTLYQPNEDLNFWGFVKARKEASTENLRVVLSKYIIDEKSEFGQDQEILNQKLELQGSQFTSKISLKNLAPDNYYLNILDKNGKTILTTTVQVQNYIKPSYKIEVSTDKTAYFVGESINYTGTVKFYDGTPVPNLELNPGDTKTDEQGNFKYAQTIKSDPNNPPSSFSGRSGVTNTFTPKNSEQGDIQADLYTTSFEYKNSIGVKTSSTDNKAQVDLQLNQIDLSRLNNGTAKNSEDFLGSAINNQSVKVIAQEYIYTQVETGTIYNLLTKKTEKTYSGGEKRVLSTKTYTANTNTEGKAKVEFATKPSSIYSLTITTSGGDNKEMSYTTEFYPESNYSGPENIPYLDIDAPVATSEIINTYGNRTEADTYKIGDPINGSFKINKNTIASGGDNYFVTILSQNGLKDAKLSTDSKVSLTFDESMVPNVGVSGLLFTGGGIYSVYGANLQFNYDNKKLNFDLSYDKESYKPGETVNLKIKVKDFEGKPISSSVNVSGVDAALYDISQNPASPLDSVYKYVPDALNYSYISHQFKVNGRGGDGGGGGRSNFTDTAVFQTVKTDSNGEGNISFKLPDNITSYKLVAQTITDDLRAGSAEKNLPVSLPFFVDAVINSTYLQGDKPVIKIRSFGKNTRITDTVSYTISSDTIGLKEQVINSRIGDSAEFTLNDLPVGEQKITIRGSYGNLEDTLIRTFVVKNAYSQKEQVSKVDYSANATITGNPSGDTQLFVTDKNRGKYYTNLTSLANTYGDRSDQFIAKNKAFELLKSYFNEQTLSTNFKLSDYQTANGGIGIYQYASDDLWLSTLVASLKDNYIDKLALKNYFNSVLVSPNESKERQLQALFGLASLGEPVLNTLQNISTDGTLSAKENLYLAFGLAASGDKESARSIFKKLSTNIKTVDNKTIFDYGQPKEKTSEDSVLLATLASILNEKIATNLFENVDTLPQETPMYLEQIIFLSNWLPNQNPAKVELSYTLNGQNTNKKLDSGEVFSVSLNSDQLKNLNLKVTSGEINLTTKYSVPLSNDNSKSSQLELTRNYSIVGETRKDIQDGDLVKIDLKYDIKDTSYKGCYNLTDYLPSGLKVETSASIISLENLGKPEVTFTYPFKTDQQSVSFCANVPDLLLQRNTISYIARVVNKGNFTADKAVLQSNQNPSLYTVTNSQKVEIK